MKNNKGFSLIELFVILVLISIGAFIAFSGWDSPENRVRSTAFQVAADMRLARQEAVKRNQKVLFCVTSNFSYDIKTNISPIRYIKSGQLIDSGADNSTRVQITPTYTGGCVSFNPIGTSTNGHITVSLNNLSINVITNRSGRIKVEQ